jgi:hypothetical protein
MCKEDLRSQWCRVLEIAIFGQGKKHKTNELGEKG